MISNHDNSPKSISDIRAIIVIVCLLRERESEPLTSFAVCLVTVGYGVLRACVIAAQAHRAL